VLADRPRRGRGLLLLLLAALAGALLAACGSTGQGDTGAASGLQVDDSDGLHGSVLDDPWQIPATTLQDTEGRDVDLSEAADQPLTLVFFGYTHCPDICLAVMSDVAGALNRLEAEQVEQVDVWFVTTDPARDDAATIRTWLDRFDPSFEGFTGRLGDITRMAQEVHVPIEKGPRLPSGGYEVTHGTPVLGVVPGGETRVVWTEGTSAAKYAADITAVLDDPDLLGGAA
jgi:protein SCO1